MTDEKIASGIPGSYPDKVSFRGALQEATRTGMDLAAGVPLMRS